MENTFLLPKFKRPANAGFSKVLKERVELYFKSRGEKPTGNLELYIKTFCMLALVFGPYALMYIYSSSMSLWPWYMQCVGVICLALITGIGIAGVGMSVMHDGSHGSYSDKSWINSLAFGVIYILGGFPYNWYYQHVVLHHTHTNTKGIDQDIGVGFPLRFSQLQKRKKYHRFQAWYALFFYSIMVLFWVFAKDFIQTPKFMKMDKSMGTKKARRNRWIVLIITKILYLLLWLVLPIVFFSNIWFALGFFVWMHFVSGTILSCTFQLAHVMPEAEMYPETGSKDIEWLEHQVRTTVNFATERTGFLGFINRGLSWYMGGLNYQIEHHCFPGVSHIHYSKISPIVRETSKEFCIPYKEHKTYWKAIFVHFQQINKLGKYDVVV